MIQIESEIILRAMPGMDISDYIKESLVVVQNNNIENALLTFNGWSYTIGTNYQPYTVEYLVGSYDKFRKSK